MVLEGVDYSYSRPTPGELVAAGKRFACRYVSTPGHAKNLTAAERQGLQAKGLAIVIVGEITPSRALGGYTQGVADMRSWRQQVIALGGPPDGGVILMAVDFDVLDRQAVARSIDGRELRAIITDLPAEARQGDPWALGELGEVGKRALELRTMLRAAQMPVVLDYLRGGASVQGYQGTGPYGEYDVVAANHVAKAGAYNWQTYAWSGGRLHEAAQLFQYRNNVTLGSGTVDLDRAFAADYGQWGAQQAAGWWTRPLGPAELAQLADGFTEALR